MPVFNDADLITVGSTEADAVMLNGVEVWTNAPDPGSMEWNTVGTRTWVVPARVKEVTLCMIGGGGSGAQNYTTAHRGGGYAGTVVSRTVAVTPGASVTVVVGAGGAAQTTNQGAGANGGQSKFGSVTANGGQGGGVVANTYNGQGAARTTCYGTAYDGIARYDWPLMGGQAGFGRGGDGGYWQNTGVAESGLKGGGGGGGDARNSSSGAGGVGVVKITWG